MLVTENNLAEKVGRVRRPTHVAKRKQVPLPKISIISSERYPHHGTNTQQVVKNANAFHEAGIPVKLE